MATSLYGVSIHIQNHLFTALTDPRPHLIHGIVDGDEWPTILPGKTSDEIRIFALNAEDGVEGSVAYNSNVEGIHRQVTFRFTCNPGRNSASTHGGLMVASVTHKSEEPPLVVTYNVHELVD